ncbi:MFS transporter [Ancylobacter sp. Lp-2]|uniref:MFS transporter n=1 Tax=Ancylobacter sp. Lp-2 TaxID=2881339 RepID=UPI001E38E5DE|nr:MFS transporter [Ancylobacter sp. Lp-2]MCB4771578.1 MFS transporter [Ancylobacter sp. Lp-2]
MAESLTSAKPSWSRRTFSALAHRNYRLLWTGTLISHTGDWMDQVALNWFVVSTSGSPFELALVNLCRGLPILLFTLVGGAIADRVERRRLMMMTQSCAMLLAFVLSALVLSGAATIFAVLLIATARGIVISFNLPVRHSLIPELVPASDLPNAVALNSLTVNVTKIVGPALAGLIIATLGTGACFLINGLSFLVVIWTLGAMRFPVAAPANSGQSLHQSIVEGVAYVRNDRSISLLVLVALVPTFFGQPYLTLLALFAYTVFQIGPEGLGLLTSSAAAGSVLGALAIAAFPRVAASGRAMLGFLILFGGLLVAFALNPSVVLAPILLLGVGAMQIAYNASNNTILQMRVPNHMRGRVTSILLMNRGLVQLGAASSAAIAGLFGVQSAVAATGFIILAFGSLILLRSDTLSAINMDEFLK